MPSTKVKSWAKCDWRCLEPCEKARSCLELPCEKKFKSRLRDVRALWEKGGWQFEEKVADKQERMNGQGRQGLEAKTF